MSYDSEALTSRGSAGTSSVGMLLQLVGGWSKPSGRGMWMFRSMTVGFATAAFVGLTFAVSSGLVFIAGAQAFALGSCIGFVGGTIMHFRNSLADARLAVLKHPRLMQHHLDANFPMVGWDNEDLAQRRKAGSLRQLFEGARTWQHQSQLIAAHQTALSTLVDLESQREKAIINEEYAM